MKSFASLTTIVLVVLVKGRHAFTSPQNVALGKSNVGMSTSSSKLQASVNLPSKGSNFWIPKEKLSFRVFKIWKGEKQKVLNLYGLWVLAVSLVTVPPWVLALTLEQLRLKINKKWDPNRSFFDKLGKIWSKVWLRLIGSYPTQSGNVDLLKGKGVGPCLYVANHGSWLDIPIVCTVVEPVFKFIAKGDLKVVPGIGRQLTGGNHILIEREDKRSQLKTFKDSVKYLKSGVPLMVFPEGTRSKSGRLMDFKGGMFAMARKTGVPIIPLTISHSYAVWPDYALVPSQRGANKLHVHVHDPIESEGKTEDELAELVLEAFVDKLPDIQLPAALTWVSEE